MPYNEEVMQADRAYQSEPTEQNELKLEKAKLKYWTEKLKENPGDEETKRRIAYHQEEVTRLETEVKWV